MEKNEDFNFKQVPGLELNKVCSKEGEPLISIATAYYNSKDYIMQTAYSVLNQTFPFWEWNIVNDGSNVLIAMKKRDKMAEKEKKH